MYVQPVQRTKGKPRDPITRARLLNELLVLDAAPDRSWGAYARLAERYSYSVKSLHAIREQHRRGPRGPRAVYAKEVTEGKKLGPVSATYVSQVTCPSDCVFRGAGCYAEHGPLAMVTTRRLNRAETTPLAVAHEEAAAIDRLSGTRDLRLHVVGDCATDEAARIVASAAERYTARGGGCVWTYTHAWRTVRRSSWGSVSVLASCEIASDVALARSRGYAAAITVQEHTGSRLANGVLPCPEQTRGVQCTDCRLCTDDTRLRDAGIAIAFALHGDRAGLARARRTLEQRG